MERSVREYIMGFRSTQLIYVAAKLGLADHLIDGPQTPERLAQVTGTDPIALHRVLRALASLGLFTQTTDGAYTLTPQAEQLRTDMPGSLRNLAILYGEDWLWQAYGQMLYSVQTGESAFDHVHGQPLYAYLEHHPSAGQLFHAAMSGYSALETAAILSAYDFSPLRTVIDIGGSEGALMVALLQAYPRLNGVVFDVEAVINQAEKRLGELNLSERIKLVAGNFFTDVPADGDLYILKSILHNWDSVAAQRILQNCRRAMSTDARLLIVERLVELDNGPSESKLFDINMLVVTGGQERTEQEYQMILRNSGFQLTRIIPTHSPLSLLEAVPIG